jgi:heme/copper-type cytochrome/quinol oxidase subunit 2
MFRRTAILRTASLLLAVAIIAMVASLAEACPTCKLALGSHDKAQGDIASAYMYSILFMMAMPFVLLGSFGTYVYFQIRKARRTADEQASPPASVRDEQPISV